MPRRRLLVASAVSVLALVFIASGSARTDTSFAVTGPVISQVYGGGGNSGAAFTNDFVELFNPTDSDISLGGSSVQYASTSGTSWQVTQLAGTLAAHHYYLVQEAQGTGGTTSLPAPDASGTIAMSASSGKVALVAGTAALSGSCPVAVDFVGFGTANCAEGTAAPGLSNTTADFRADGGCTDTNDNSADFSAAAPAPRNSASASYSCGVVTTPQPEVTCPANVTVDQGDGFERSVSASDADGTVTSFSVTPSSGFSIGDVQAATAAGGTATATVSGATTLAPGSYDVQVTAANDDATPQAGSCSFRATVVPTLAIGEVQGSGDASPYAGQTVSVRGVVTELTSDSGNNGFFLQSTDATADGDPATSDGIFVFMSHFSDLVNGYVPVVGDEVQLQGRVSEFFDQTELGSARATKVGTGSVTPFAADPPADAGAADAFWEAHEGMQGSIPARSVVDSPTHFYSSTADTEFYVISADSPIAQRSNPYAQRAFREAHPLDDGPNGNGFRILITDEGIKSADANARLTPVHTFQKLAQPVVGGVYYDFGKYSVSAAAQPQVVDGVDPSQNGAPQPFDRAQAYSIANFNMENLYDYRDDPNDGCDFPGNSGCPGVTPPFDYTPASDAEYQGRETEIAHQIVDDLHSPDVMVVAEAEDQDICSVQDGAFVCGDTNNADGQPDDLEELALHVAALGGPQYAATFDRDGADARGIVCAFMYRTDRVSLLSASAGDPVLGSNPAVDYRGAPLPYDTDVSNPKALNAVLPEDVDRSTGVDGTNVFTRAVQVAHFRIAPTTLLGVPSDVWVAANHFTSNPDVSVGQRQEQAAYNAAVVRAIQSQDADAKVMVAGDLNVYPRPDSDQLHALYDAGLQDLYDTVLAQNPSSAYSYVFEGQAQDLDHQFVTPSFYDRLAAVHEAHVNSDWSRVPGSNRGTSDHDPMVSQYGLTTFRGVCELATSYDAAAGATVCLALARAEKFAGRGMDAQLQDALDTARHEVAKGGFTPDQAARLLELIGELSTV